MRRAATVVAAVALLVVGGAAAATAPTDDELQDPIESRGPVGRTVVARSVEVEAHGVVAARRLRFPDSTVDSGTPGVWVAIDLTVACRTDACSFTGSRLRSRGAEYASAVLAPAPSFRTLLASPGVRYRTTALFEVPDRVLGDPRARLVVQQATTPALDSVPVVDLAVPSEVRAVVEVEPTAVIGALR